MNMIYYFFSVKQKFVEKEDLENQMGSWGAKANY